MSLTLEQLSELERHAQEASNGGNGGVCTVEASELRELLMGYRLLLLLSGVAGEITELVRSYRRHLIARGG